MFRPAAVFIGLRYTRAKRRNHFISFISLMSMLGIALGVLVLITVLSVMNGFDKEIKQRVFSMWPPITAGTYAGVIDNWREAETITRKIPTVTGVAPFVSAEVLITNNGSVQPAMLNGIDPEQEKTISAIDSKIISGNLTSLLPGEFGILLGEELADRLGATVGEKITVMTPQVSVSPAGAIPRFKRFTVVGIFRVGSGFGFDANLAYIHITDAQRLMELGNAVSGLHVTIQNVYAAPEVGAKIAKAFGPSARIDDWTSQFGAYFHAISMEKTMMFLILMLIIAVAVFNLVCSLVMVVNDKESDIAILRTFGATPGTIMSIFIVQGTIIGVIGTFIGIISGIALAMHVTEIVKGIEHLFHVQFLSSSVYFVNYLPSEILVSDVVQIGVAALVLSLLATLYPAWRAARTEPVEALRYE